MTACIMNNMIIEDERDNANIVNAIPPAIPNVELFTDETERFRAGLFQQRKLKNKENHYARRNALIDHLWDRHGNAPN